MSGVGVQSVGVSGDAMVETMRESHAHSNRGSVISLCHAECSVRLKLGSCDPSFLLSQESICVFVSRRHWLPVVLVQAGNQFEYHGFPLPKGTGMTGERLHLEVVSVILRLGEGSRLAST